MLIKKVSFFISSILILSFLGACGLVTTRPKLEMSMAQTAFLAAQEAGAQTKAATLYRKAEFYYLKAKSNYRRKYFAKAKQYALLSKKFSENAEYKSKMQPNDGNSSPVASPEASPSAESR